MDEYYTSFENNNEGLFSLSSLVSGVCSVSSTHDTGNPSNQPFEQHNKSSLIDIGDIKTENDTSSCDLIDQQQNNGSLLESVAAQSNLSVTSDSSALEQQLDGQIGQEGMHSFEGLIDINNIKKESINNFADCQPTGDSECDSTQNTQASTSDLKDSECVLCVQCNKWFDCMNDLKKHNIIVHKGKRPFECQDCGQTFVKNSGLSSHKRWHQKRKSCQKLTCVKCDKWFDCLNDLKKHNQVAHKEKSRPFQCQECDHTFIRKSGLSIHQKWHQNMKSLQRIPYIPSHVRRKRTSQMNRKKHAVKNPIMKPFFKCQVCGKLFFNKTVLKIHEKTHPAENSQPRLITDSASKKGVHRANPKNQLFLCGDCNTWFSGRKTLHVHNKSIHAGVKRHEQNFKLKKITGSFIRVQNRNLGKLLQMENKRYEKHKFLYKEKITSIIVSAGDPDKRNLKKHAFFLCRQCKKWFCSRKNLENHSERMHKGGRNVKTIQSVHGKTLSGSIMVDKCTNTEHRCKHCNKWFLSRITHVHSDEHRVLNENGSVELHQTVQGNDIEKFVEEQKHQKDVNKNELQPIITNLQNGEHTVINGNEIVEFNQSIQGNNIENLVKEKQQQQQQQEVRSKEQQHQPYSHTVQQQQPQQHHGKEDVPQSGEVKEQASKNLQQGKNKLEQQPTNIKEQQQHGNEDVQQHSDIKEQYRQVDNRELQEGENKEERQSTNFKEQQQHGNEDVQQHSDIKDQYLQFENRELQEGENKEERQPTNIKEQQQHGNEDVQQHSDIKEQYRQVDNRELQQGENKEQQLTYSEEQQQHANESVQQHSNFKEQDQQIDSEELQQGEIILERQPNNSKEQQHKCINTEHQCRKCNKWFIRTIRDVQHDNHHQHGDSLERQQLTDSEKQLQAERNEERGGDSNKQDCDNKSEQQLQQVDSKIPELLSTNKELRSIVPFCTICSIWFSTKKELESHQERKHKDNTSNTSNFAVVNEHYRYFSYSEQHGDSSTEQQKRKQPGDSGNQDCSSSNKRQRVDNNDPQQSDLASIVPFCAVCTIWFSTRKELKDHQELHAGNEDGLDHQITDRVNSTSVAPHQEVDNQSDIQNLNIFFKCVFCEMSFTNSQDLDCHQQRHIERPYKCTQCGMGFAEKTLLESHHDQCWPFRCNVCFQKFDIEESIESHSLIMHKDSQIQEIYKCGTCLKGFPRIRSLKNHIQLRKTRDPCVLKCHICHKECKTGEVLGEHFSQEHKETSVLKCLLCDEEFDSGRSYTKHCQEQHNGEQRRHTSAKPQCPICNKEFLYPSSLTKHTMVHTGEKSFAKPAEKFECTVCGEMLNNGISFWIHFYKHSNGKPFKCSICGEGFVHQNSLKIHSKTHIGGKMFKCKFCHIHFQCRKTFENHVMKHKAQKFKCNVCNSVFKYKATYDLHLCKPASGLKPFECMICNRTYRYKRNLTAHYADKHTGKKSSKCNEKPVNFNEMAVRCNKKLPFECNEQPLECNVKPLECHEKPLECNVKPFECNEQQLECNVKPLECHEKPLECNVKPFECNEQQLECNVKPLECHEKPLECNVKPFECNEQPLECNVKPLECHEKSMERNVKPLECHEKPLECNVKPLECHEKSLERNVKPLECHEKSLERNVKPLECHEKPLECNVKPFELHENPLERSVKPLECHEKPLECNVKPLECHEKSLERNVKPLECHEKSLERNVKPLECHEKSLERNVKPLECHEKPLECNVKPFELHENPLECSGKPLVCHEKPLECNVKIFESNEKPSECSEKPLERKKIIRIKCKTIGMQ